jgi:hypothetical protein
VLGSEEAALGWNEIVPVDQAVIKARIALSAPHRNLRDASIAVIGRADNYILTASGWSRPASSPQAACPLAAHPPPRWAQLMDRMKGGEETMKRQICIGLVLSATLVVLGMRSGLAQSSQYNEDWAVISANTTSAATAPWFIDTVDSATDVGRHVSVAVDRKSGMTFISYYDATNGDLRLARYVGSGGNCGPSDAWICETVDSDGDVGQYNSIATTSLITLPVTFGSEGNVGQYNSIATYPSANAVWLFISYYDATNGALKYAEGICSLSSCSLATYTIDRGNPGINVFKGLHTSVKRDWGGVHHIAYQYYGVFSAESQLYAHWVGDGTGNCGEGSVAGDWQCDVIYNDDGVGMYASLDLDGDDDPSIAFYDADNGYPWVAAYIGSGGNCGPANSWYCRRVHQPTLDTGRYVSLYVEDSGLAHIAYHNVTSGTLEYAEWVGSGGNCGFNSASLQWEWQCDEIDDTGTSLTSMGVALAEDGAGYPIIAYQDGSPDADPVHLKVARPHVALDPNTVPNCGPEDLFLTWYCEIIDGGGAYTDEAGSVSLAVNTAGLATIAYHELDNYPYPVEGNLKVAYQRLHVFLPLVLKNW